jgi:hypothetical protein
MNGIVLQTGSGDLVFGTGGNQASNERMRIIENGNIGIGTTAPNSKLQINGYIQLATTSGNAPSTSDCDENTEYGRMKIDEVNNLLYICTQSGWVSK